MTPEQRTPHDDDVFETLQCSLLSRFPAAQIRFCQTPLRFTSQRTSWSCSYASGQMIISSLLQYSLEYRLALFQGVNFVPDVPSLQRVLEQAWMAGYDPEGGQFFNFKLVQQRIGISDLAALFRFQLIPFRIVDFKQCLFSVVTDFCAHYFHQPQQPLFPLILGTKSHTVVIVGWCAGHLLVFDPSVPEEQAFVRAQRNVDKFFFSPYRAGKPQDFQIGLVGDDNGVLFTCPADKESGSPLLRSLHPTDLIRTMAAKSEVVQQ